jgi:hypothetical protein
LHNPKPDQRPACNQHSQSDEHLPCLTLAVFGKCLGRLNTEEQSAAEKARFSLLDCSRPLAAKGVKSVAGLKMQDKLWAFRSRIEELRFIGVF